MEIIYIGEIDFAKDDASTRRILTIAKALKLNKNYHIKLLGYGNIESLNKDGFKTWQVKRGKNFLDKIFHLFFRGVEVVELVKRRLSKPDLIIYYGNNSRFLLPLLHYCHKSNISLIVDIVEWYNYSHLPFNYGGWLSLDVHLGITRLIPRCDGVITISSYLQKYYSQRGMYTLKVPPLVEEHGCFNPEIGNEFFNESKLNLIYAGIPGKKDLLHMIIQSVETINSLCPKITFHILGFTKVELVNFIHENISEDVICYGKIDQNLVSHYLKKADFSIILRPNERFAMAGFPTKFVESLAVGLPVIANLTSDLDEYLKSGFNGFIVEEPTERALIKTLETILSIGRSEWEVLKSNALKTANERFLYKLYSDSLISFIRMIRSDTL